MKGEGGTAVNDRTVLDDPLGLVDGLPVDHRPRHEGTVIGREAIDEAELHGVVFAGGLEEPSVMSYVAEEVELGLHRQLVRQGYLLGTVHPFKYSLFWA